jgi:2'-5' RNA ligase
MTRPTQTALIADVPDAEPAVGRHRQHLDESAAWGVPPHVTVLYPFVAPEDVTPKTIREVGVALAGVHAFDCVFAQVNWFGEDVVWLAPEPAEPFLALTEAVYRQFPDHPPYGGAHAELVPHLTIGSSRVADLPDLRRAAAEVRSALPIATRIERVRFIAGTEAPGSWRTLAEFTLSTPD